MTIPDWVKKDWVKKKQVTRYAWGRHAVLEALRGSQPVRAVLHAADLPASLLEELERLAAGRGVALRAVPREALDRIHPRHQGLAVALGDFRYTPLEEILAAAARRGEPPLVLVLDLLQDPQNLGTLLRTAEAVGAHGAAIQERRAAGISAAVHRASAGAVAHLPMARVSSLAAAIRRLKEAGLWICGLHPAAELAYHEADLRGPLALVVGSEGRGLRRLVRERCDFLVRLPMEGRVASLNAAVAGSVVLYEAWRQRRAEGRSLPRASPAGPGRDAGTPRSSERSARTTRPRSGRRTSGS